MGEYRDELLQSTVLITNSHLNFSSARVCIRHRREEVTPALRRVSKKEEGEEESGALAAMVDTWCEVNSLAINITGTQMQRTTSTLYGNW